MRAIVLAAGAGTRLGFDGPKCMVPLAGRPLLHWQLDALRAEGVDDILIVAGYRADDVDPLGAEVIVNPLWKSTNMVESFFRADEVSGDGPLLVAYGDLVYRRALVRTIARCDQAIVTLVGTEWLELWTSRFADPLDDAEALRLSGERLIDIGGKPRALSEIDAQYVGLTRLSQSGRHQLRTLRAKRRESQDWDSRIDMTQLLSLCLRAEVAIHVATTSKGWLEVDSPTDLALYEQIMAGSRLKGWMAD